MFDDRGSRMVDGNDEVNSALDIFVKDMGLVIDAARDSTYPAPLARRPNSSTSPAGAQASAAGTTRP